MVLGWIQHSKTMQDVTNITCQQIFIYIYMVYVQTDLAKIKGSTRGFESVVVIIEYSATFSYHLRRLDYASVAPDHTTLKTVSSTP